MKKLNFLLFALCISCISINGQTKKQELKLKKAISKFANKVKNIDDRDKKEKVLEAFVSKLEEINNKSEFNGATKKEKQEFNKNLDVIIDGFGMVKGGSNESLNDYVDYIESEFNQAVVDWVLIGGIILGIYLIAFLFPNLFLM
jgi:hypothetical protein